MRLLRTVPWAGALAAAMLVSGCGLSAWRPGQPLLAQRTAAAFAPRTRMPVTIESNARPSRVSARRLRIWMSSVSRTTKKMKTEEEESKYLGWRQECGLYGGAAPGA